jgi:hypothetical protein
MVFVDVTLLPNPSSAGKTIHAELKCPCKNKMEDAVGRPRSRSSLLRHPDALFFCEASDEYRKRETSKNEKHSPLPSGARV